jgi:glycosyltransferase involved in cell wall biosynthesis
VTRLAGAPDGADLPRCAVVLMSTYNGAPYVVEQLRSILDQLPPGGRIAVRDDGSRDGTAQAIRSLDDPRVTLQVGQNLGFSRSFLTLLAAVPVEADLVMFADQDDVWLPGKIERAWRALQRCGAGPALYGSTQMLTDEALRPLNVTHRWMHPPSFRGALVENMITGCTAALNRPALHLLQRAGVPQDVHFHDWWLYLVVAAHGRVVFDAEPSLLYRQHGANQIGHGAGRFGRQWHIVRFLLRKDWVGILLGQVHALQRHYGGSLGGAERQLVETYFRIGPASAAPRWRLVFGFARWRDTWASELAFRVLLLLHKLHVWPPPARRLRPSGPT